MPEKIAVPPEILADLCDGQLPVFSTMGRGIKGDSARVVMLSDSDEETVIKGVSYDEESGETKDEWVSGNLNAGKVALSCQMNPHASPKTFNITLRLIRPGREEWSWTSPNIPYMAASGQDTPGSNIAALYAKNKRTGQVSQDLGKHPEGWTPEQLNIPAPNTPFSANVEFGMKGDVDCPTTLEASAILGISTDDLGSMAARQPPANLKFAPQSGGSAGVELHPETFKEYVDLRCEDLQRQINEIKANQH